MNESLTSVDDPESPSVLLEEYAREAVDNYLTAEAMAKQAKHRSFEAVQAALLCGQALTRAKTTIDIHPK